MDNLKKFAFAHAIVYLLMSLGGVAAVEIFNVWTWMQFLTLSQGSTVGIAVSFIIFYLKGEFNE